MGKRNDSDLPLPATLRESFRHCRRIMLVCAVLCLIVRVVVAIHVANHPLQGDALYYDSVATSLVSGHGRVHEGYPTSDKAPGYETFVAGMYALFGHKFVYVYLLQGLLAALVCGATVLLAYGVTLTRAVALLTGLAMALHPGLVVSDAALLTDSLFGFLMLGLTLLLGLGVVSRKLWPWAAGGVLLGLALYVRPTALAVPVMFLGLAVWRRWRLRRAVVAAAALCAVAGIVLLPWAVRNQRLFGKFTPLPAQGGRVLYCNWSVKHPQPPVFRLMPEDVKRKIGSRIAYERDRVLKREAIREIRARPGEFAASCLIKSARQWTNLFWARPPSAASIGFAVVNLITLALAVPSLWRKRLEPVFRSYSLLYMLYITFVASVMSSGEVRYAFWTYPFVFILAADSAYEIWHRISGRAAKRAG